MNERVARIRECLMRNFSPSTLEIEDESHRHAGHAGALDGRGHFRVHMVAAIFSGMPMIDRHRRIYSALDELMHTDIHALALNVRAPEEILKHEDNHAL